MAKKFVSIITAAVLLFCSLSFFDVKATGTKDPKDVEVVLLLDVSGSMNQADPLNSMGGRLSVEAAQQFVFYYPTEIEMHVKVIPYNSRVYDGFSSENINTEGGRKNYKKYMDYILQDSDINDTVPGITCWNYTTDIGAALEAANNYLSESTKEKKSVILFTDGRIDLGGDAAKEQESKKKAEDSRAALEKAGIPIYCVGLNKNGSVDTAFLENLSSSDKTPGKTFIITDSNELSHIFKEIYTYLFPNSKLSDDVDNITVNPDVESDCNVRIYGHAVKEANITLESKAPLHSITVTAPSGAVVAHVDILKNKTEINSNDCTVELTSTNASAIVKLTKPEDGDWVISVKGKESTVIVSKLFLFDLKLKDDINLDKIFAGENFKFNTTIFNLENNIHVSSQNLYVGDSAAKAYAEVVELTTNNKKTYNGVLNSTENGFDFNIAFERPGKYDINMSIKHSQFDLKLTKTIDVIAPILSLKFGKAEGEDKNVIDVFAVNPLTNKMIETLPSYLSAAEGTVQILSDKEVIHEQKFKVSDMTSGKYVVSYEPAQAGTYYAKANLTSYDINIESDKIELSYEASKIEKKGKWPSSLEFSGFSADISEKVDIENVFADSDGDQLTYTLIVPDKSNIEAEIKNGAIYIEGKDFGETTIKLLIEDGKGAKAEYTIDISVNSLIPLLIGIIVAAVVVIVALIVFLIFVNKRKVLRLGFRVRLAVETESSYETAVFEVMNLSNNKSVKGAVALTNILSPEKSYSTVVNNEFGNSLYEIVNTCCDGIVLVGCPFKKAFNIKLKGNNVGTFSRSQVRVNVKDKNCVLTFGTNFDFN